MLQSHARNHNYFVANSELVNVTSAMKSLHGMSPTSRNLSLLLRLLTQLCVQLKAVEAVAVTRILLLHWSTDLLLTCKPCTVQLSQAVIFQQFLVAVVHFCSVDVADHAESSRAVKALLEVVFDLPDILLDVSRTLIPTRQNSLAFFELLNLFNGLLDLESTSAIE